MTLRILLEDHKKKDTELDPQRAKVRADYRKWVAGKLNRCKWGEKVEVTVNQKIDIGPILLEAQERMKSIVVGNRLTTHQDASIEAESSDTNME